MDKNDVIGIYDNLVENEDADFKSDDDDTN